MFTKALDKNNKYLSILAFFGIMKSKFKIFSNWGFGLYKFIGDVEVEDILDLIKEGYSNKDFNKLSHTLLDFRECTL